MYRRMQFILLFLLFALSTNQAWSETYPEFTGNYIKKNGAWCKLEAYQLNVMMLEDGGRFTSYGGYFSIPDVIQIKEQKPQLLFYTGRQSADPRTIALVKLEKLPFNNDRIHDLDGEDYNTKLRYSTPNMKNELWTFKREVPVRFKPIEGKIGMVLFEPEEPLEGFYAIDVGSPHQEGHSNLSTAPLAQGFFKLNRVLTALPFIVGSVTDPGSSKTAAEEKKNSNTNEQDANAAEPKSASEELGKAIGNAIFKSLKKRGLLQSEWVTFEHF